MKEKTIFEDYIKNKFNIWELICENGELGFEVTTKKNKLDIRWFLRRKYVRQKRHKDIVYYVPNMRNKIVKNVIQLFKGVLSEAIDNKDYKRNKK